MPTGINTQTRIDVIGVISKLFEVFPFDHCDLTVSMLLQHCNAISNSYTMDCPPVRGDNLRALASGLSYVQVDKHGITILYHLHQCWPCTSSNISC